MNLKAKFTFTIINHGEEEGILEEVILDTGELITQKFQDYCNENNIILHTDNDVKEALYKYTDEVIMGK